MKVLMLAAHFYPMIGGAEKSSMAFAKSFQSGGDNVAVVTRREEGATDYEAYNHIPIYRINFPIIRLRPDLFIVSSARFIINLYRLYKIVLRFKPEIIFVHMLSENALLASALLFFYKCRLVSSPRGYDTILYKNNKINRLLFQRLLNKSENIIFASNDFYLESIKDGMYFFDKEKIKIIPNGIDLTPFDQNRAKFELDQNRQYILGCGKLVFDKGFDILIRAFHLICKQHPSIDLVIIGKGPERNCLESLVQSLNITSRVHFLGLIRPEKIIAYYQGCIFFVMPSRFEAFGNVTIEAMAAKKPVIGSNKGGTADLIKDNFNGFLFESENLKMLADKMNLLLSDSTQRELLGLNARELVEKKYSLEKVYGNKTLADFLGY